MSGYVIVPWYATGFRGHVMQDGLEEISAIAPRYGARSYAVYRARDDRYKFQQVLEFDSHTDWERYWEGPEMIDFRTRYSGRYQVPLLYGWWDRTAYGEIERAPAAAAPAAAPANGGAGNTH
jgi:hypothetical protein